jgi:hypothetical protein
MTQLRDRRTGYDWCRERTPSPIVQMGFQRGVEGFSLSGRSPFELLQQRSATDRDGTQVLQLLVRSRQYPVELKLSWRLRPGVSPVETWYRIINRAPEPLTVTRATTFSLLVGAEGGRTLHYVEKGTAQPGTLRGCERSLNEGDTESIYCSSSVAVDDLKAIPWFVLDRGKGGLYFAWPFSESGRFTFSRAVNTIVLTGGLRLTRFRYQLPPGGGFLVPAGLFATYAGVPDDAAREWHRFLRRHWSPPPPDPLFPLVQYRTRYSLGSNINEKNCLEQLRAAAALGVELFQVDAGWCAAAGDWQPDRRRFPRGLRPLAQEARQRGVRFGLWVPLTQIGKEVLTQHPDWATSSARDAIWSHGASVPNATLCLGNPAARAWLQQNLERIVRDCGLDLLAYDAPVIEHCTLTTHGHQSGDGGYAATLGYYEVLDGLRRRFPRLLLKSASRGGRMIDFGMERRTHCMSIADYPHPADDRHALYEATRPLPPSFCEMDLENARSLSPAYLCRSAMMGTWTISADVTAWDDATRAVVRHHIAVYKRLRPLIRDGDIYHPRPPVADGKWDALEYYDPRRGEGVVFVFRDRSAQTRCWLPLAGLSEGDYEVRFEDEPVSVPIAGGLLQQKGVEVLLPHPFSATVIYLKSVSSPRSR